MFRKSKAEDAFVALLTSNQTRLRAYLTAMVRQETEAEDLLQETNLALWKKRDKYDSSREFFPWACGVAFIEVLRLRRKRATDKLWFDQPLLETLTSEFIGQVQEHDGRRDALPGCLSKLKNEDKWLIENRFRADKSVAKLAEETGKTTASLYDSLARIRAVLYKCIQKNVAQQAHSHLRAGRTTLSPEANQ